MLRATRSATAGSVMTHRAEDEARSVAIVREVSETYPDCCLRYQPRQPINLALAKIQHRAYVDALRGLGLSVLVLPADHRFPDACFVEDAAVVLDEIAVITRMGAERRNGEQQAVARCLAQWRELVYMEPPAQLEGGDVLQAGRRLLVGESSRTNREGIEFLKEVADNRGYQVIVVPVHGALHLKTVVTAVAPTTVIAAPSTLPELKPYLPGFSILEVPEEDASAANVLSRGGAVLVQKGYPAVAARLARLGLTVTELDISEFSKGEGGLTCLSIIID